VPNEVQADHRSWRSQAVVAAVHRACTNCGAPGVWSMERRIQEGWPGCYVDPTDPRAWLDDKSVGDTCPNCGASRGPGLLERLGEIWRKFL
jgi:hypothetical protein